MKNVVTGLLIVFFVSVYILSVSSVQLEPRKSAEVELCGVSVGNGGDYSKITKMQNPSLKIVFFHGHAESLIDSIDTDFSFDLFALSEKVLPDSNNNSSKFISRENQKPRQRFKDPVFIPS